MKIPKLLVLLFTFLIVQSTTSYAQHYGGTVLNARGVGMVEVEPDQATLRFSVVAEHENPEEAMRQNEDASAAALRAVRGLGVEDRHIQVQNVHLQPKREWDEPGRRWVELGFEATRYVEVTVTDLDTLPALVSAVVENGANRLQQLQYELADQTAAELEALGLAVGNARARALAMAAALGHTEVFAVRVIEEGANMPAPVMATGLQRMMSKDESMQEGAPNPEAYSAGLIEVRVAVTAEFGVRYSK